MRDPLIVLKFGSSVLRSASDLPHAVHEIYRWVRAGYKVVAVVSAFAGETDRLFAEVDRYPRFREGDAIARLVATGEETTAALLVLELDHHGVPAEVMDPSQLRLRVREDADCDAEPCDLNPEAIHSALARSPVVVVPGFIGRDRRGRLALLGRGGSDLSAIFIAHRLRARCRLLKDVDGLHEADPALDRSARRFEMVTWEQASRVGSQIVQPKAIAYAKQHDFAFEIASIQSAKSTLVSSRACRLALSGRESLPLRVGLLGLGIVGLGVYRYLARYPQLFQVTKIAVRHPENHLLHAPRHLLTTDCWQVLRNADVVVELIGGSQPAASLIEAGLRAGKSVVTANKMAVAESALHANGGVAPCFSAAVGGAVPALETVRRVGGAAEIREIHGVLNGTTNFVLDRVAAGDSFAAAIAEAQRQGFAEADPTSDLSGADTARKLALLAHAAFGVNLPVEQIDRTGIERLDAAWVRQCALEGRAVRLIGSAMFRQGKVRAWVRPDVFADGHVFAAAREEHNAVVIRTDSEDHVVRGRGAGRWPTSLSVMADLFDLVRDRAATDISRGPFSAQPVVGLAQSFNYAAGVAAAGGVE